jgi:hypothetical protein
MKASWALKEALNPASEDMGISILFFLEWL